MEFVSARFPEIALKNIVQKNYYASDVCMKIVVCDIFPHA